MHLKIFSLDLIGFHVWRQTQTQTVIQNFYKEDFNILNPKVNEKADTDRVFRMEFPVMQWLFSVFYKIFGNHIIISRILSFLIGLFSVLGIFFLLFQIFNDKILAALGAWAFNFSPVFYYYTMNPLPDNFALCCGIWFAAFLFKWIRKQNKWSFLISVFFLCLSALAKLPFILFGSLFLSYLFFFLVRKDKKYQSAWKYFLLFLFLILPVFLWYVNVIPDWHGNGIVAGIMSETDYSKIPDILFHNLVSTLPELLINYGSLLFFLLGIFLIFKRKLFRKNSFVLYAFWGMSIVAYFLFEINMIDKVHDYYLFPFLPLIFILVAYGIKNMIYSKSKALKYISFFLLTILPLTAYLRSNSRWNTVDPGFNAVLYNSKSKLQTIGTESSLCVVGNDQSHYIFLYYINRKGWVFDNDNLNEADLKNWIQKGATYLFSDCRKDTLPEIKKYLDRKIFEQGTLKVFSLKTDFN